MSDVAYYLYPDRTASVLSYGNTKTKAREQAGGPTSAPIFYSQCWEDADILLAALAIEPGDLCLSIASAGDNTLALLAQRPERVVAIDRNAAQLACLELRVAAYKKLDYDGMIYFLGLKREEKGPESITRRQIYARLREHLSPEARSFWDNRIALVEKGIARSGKFESYFAIFRNLILPLVHSSRTVDSLLSPRSSRQERLLFYEQSWNTPAWRLMFRFFFSRAIMGTLARQRSCFNFVEGPVAERIFNRVEYALVELEPAVNPYLHWILKGYFGKTLPFSLRRENFEAIKQELQNNKLELRCATLDEALSQSRRQGEQFNKFNLSDVFEYMSPESHEALLTQIAACSEDGARIAFWNMLNDQSSTCCPQIRTMDRLSQYLHDIDKAFFYSSFVIQEIRKCAA